MSLQHYIKRYRHLKWTLYNCFSTVGLRRFQKLHCNHFQSSSILSIRSSFCTCCVICVFFSCFGQLFLRFTRIWWRLPLFEFCVISWHQKFQVKVPVPFLFSLNFSNLWKPQDQINFLLGFLKTQLINVLLCYKGFFNSLMILYAYQKIGMYLQQ